MLVKFKDYRSNSVYIETSNITKIIRDDIRGDELTCIHMGKEHVAVVVGTVDEVASTINKQAWYTAVSEMVND